MFSILQPINHLHQYFYKAYNPLGPANETIVQRIHWTLYLQETARTYLVV